MVPGCELDTSATGMSPGGGGSSEHGKSPSVSIKDGEILGQLIIKFRVFWDILRCT
jgi:hypothetical protein